MSEPNDWAPTGGFHCLDPEYLAARIAQALAEAQRKGSDYGLSLNQSQAAGLVQAFRNFAAARREAEGLKADRDRLREFLEELHAGLGRYYSELPDGRGAWILRQVERIDRVLGASPPAAPSPPEPEARPRPWPPCADCGHPFSDHYRFVGGNCEHRIPEAGVFGYRFCVCPGYSPTEHTS